MNEKKTDTEILVLTVCKYLILAAAIGFTVWLFWSQNTSELEFGTLCANLEESGFMDEMEQVSSEEAQTFLGISGEDCSEFYYAATPENGDVEEVLLVRTESDRASDRVVKRLQERVKKKQEKFQAQDIVQTNLLKQAVIKKRGSYVFFAVSENCASLENRFLKSLK